MPEPGGSVAVTSAAVDPTGTTPVPQRAVIVLPSTGEFDSRTYRIATTLVNRGHEVTVLARRLSGTAEVEDHPAGYRILRVEATTADGLPFPRVRGVVRRVLVKRRQLVAGAASPTAATGGTAAGGGAAGGAAPVPRSTATPPR